MSKVKPTFKGTLMFPSDWVAAEELKGDTVVTIKSVEFKNLKLADGASERKAVMHFEEAKKGLVLNKTNANIIAGLHGAEATQWPGKKITLYPTTCMAFGDEVSCIRVRKGLPK